MSKPDVSVVDADRFWASVDKTEWCWVWTGPVDRHGYGEYRQKINGKTYYWRAHRLAYELIVGKIADGLVIDHLCRNRPCVNPQCLEPVTNAENIRRGETGQHLKNGDQCRKGHPYVDGSYYLRHGKYRTCRICAADRKERWAAKQ